MSNNSILVDSHCHLDLPQFDPDRSAVLDRAKDVGVAAIIIPAITPKTYTRLLNVVESDPILYCGIGIHPHSVGECREEDLDTVEEWIHKGVRVVAVGEIGLDYYYDFSPKEKQKVFFQEQLRIAKKHNMPVIIHNREADEDLIALLEQEQDGSLNGVLHCFTGTPQLAERALALGMHISFTGIITFPKVSLDETIRAVPLDKMMLETDSPYLTPVPHRGKRNEPAFVEFVAQKVADVYGMSVEKIKEKTTRVVEQFFRISVSTLAAVCLAILLPVVSWGQEAADDTISFHHPFRKWVGIGGGAGIMTFVESPDSGRDRSYEGLPAFSVSANWFFLDRFFLLFSYTIAQNTKVQEFQANPNVHHVADFSINYTPIPYNRIAFYFSVGGSYFYNNLNRERTESFLGVNFAIGLYGNIRVPIGIIAPSMEWRVSFVTEDRILDYPPDPGRPDVTVRQNVPYFTSVPRFQIQFFPDFHKLF